jgi:acylphosphatase
MMSTGQTAMIVNITGRVQGVGFRAWTKSEAEARGLSGWVRNESDGSVSALVEGPQPDVATMLKALERGPALAKVENVRAIPGAETEMPGFRVVDHE